MKERERKKKHHQRFVVVGVYRMKQRTSRLLYWKPCCKRLPTVFAWNLWMGFQRRVNLFTPYASCVMTRFCNSWVWMPLLYSDFGIFSRQGPWACAKKNLTTLFMLTRTQQIRVCLNMTHAVQKMRPSEGSIDHDFRRRGNPLFIMASTARL